MSIRTDLAVESARQLSLSRDLEGVSQNIDISEDAALEITEITVETEKAAEILGKPQGRYITVKSSDGSLDRYSPHFEKRAQIIAEQISKLCPNCKKILVAGLGNRMITPDAIGPLCADRIFATRHIKRLSTEIDTEELSEVSVFQTGVTGQTGIEAAEQIKAICETVSPDCVIAVDALACSELSHLGCTVQLSDTGISPGSGVENARAELSKGTLGVPCIAIGVPTVVDMTTAAEHIFGTSAPESAEGMMVTPRNIDLLALNAAKYIALGINLAFQKSLTAEDILSLTE